MFTHLLAKSTPSPERPARAETLAGHLSDVVAVAAVVAGERGQGMLAALGLDPGQWHPLLTATVTRAALLHDLGKANDQFQQMVRCQRTLTQALRHEVVSLWLLVAFPELNAWLFGDLDPAGRAAAVRAVAGHHLRFTPTASLPARASGSLDLTVLAGHPDLGGALASIGSTLGLPTPPRLTNQRLPLADRLAPVDDLLWAVADWWETADADGQRFAAAVAALLIAADVCGSAIVRQGQAPATWAGAALAAGCSGDDLADAATRRLQGDPARPFQTAVASSSTRLTLVTAGCGSGKTAAAYLWGARWLAGHKLFFCYPTTGTATEGFHDYALPEFEGEAALIHSRATLDLERLLETAGDEGHQPGLERLQRYQGLQGWPAKVTVCTADAVLGLVQQNRTGMFGFPALATAGFVFDEVHLYDDRLFGALLAFLAAFRGAPALLMTATLPPGRRAALLRLADDLGEPVTEVHGPADLEALPRYRLATATAAEALDEAVRAVQAGQRVLWVANTVGRAVEVAQAAEARGCRIEPYHSRYRYLDRLDRHRTVVDLFAGDSDGAGVLAVTTQVCEVSLDLSADLLVSELAPPAALIQRLGRLNRRATPERFGGPQPGLLIEPDGHLPYTPDDLALARRWLESLTGKPVSQRDLHDAFITALGDESPATPVPAAWLESVLDLEPRPLREAGVTITVIREEDRDYCLDGTGRPDPKELTRYALPMLYGPVVRELGRWRHVHGIPVAPRDRIDYSTRWGARWR
ncbi:MAG: CRISPR-associated helicase Cas3' [Chloroflexi bacterium]|nr:CRISPR-associated helicase Cas3' [Chloroflexota bacterium]